MIEYLYRVRTQKQYTIDFKLNNVEIYDNLLLNFIQHLQKTSMITMFDIEILCLKRS